MSLFISSRVLFHSLECKWVIFHVQIVYIYVFVVSHHYLKVIFAFGLSELHLEPIFIAWQEETLLNDHCMIIEHLQLRYIFEPQQCIVLVK